MARGKKERRRFRAIPLWAWPLWAVGAVVCVSMVHLLFFASDAGSRIVVANDTTARLRLFECNDATCTQGVGGNDSVLDPGEAAADVWDASDGTGRVGEATSPGNRLIGCLPAPHTSQNVPQTHAVLASSVTPCPGQKRGSMPVVVMLNP
jgi:hypothetical protein